MQEKERGARDGGSGDEHAPHLADSTQRCESFTVAAVSSLGRERRSPERSHPPPSLSDNSQQDAARHPLARLTVARWKAAPLQCLEWAETRGGGEHESWATGEAAAAYAGAATQFLGAVQQVLAPEAQLGGAHSRGKRRRWVVHPQDLAQVLDSQTVEHLRRHADRSQQSQAVVCGG